MITGVKTMETTLNEAFNYSPVENEGIFHYLQDLEVPWKDDNIDGYLDLYYHNNHSGNKITSPLIDSFIYDGQIPTESKEDLASIIFALYGVTWVRMWNIYTSEYEPLQNYDMTEHMSSGDTIEYGKSETRTDDLTQERTDDLTHERTVDLTDTERPLTEKTTDKKVFAFNSVGEDGEPFDKIIESEGGTNTIEHDGTDTVTDTGTETQTNTGTQKLEQEGEDTKEHEHTLTRFGNIGVTTTQQMAQQELDLWKWNFFKNVIFPNIDGVLTIALY